MAFVGSNASKRSSTPSCESPRAHRSLPSLTISILSTLTVEEMLINGVAASKLSRSGSPGARTRSASDDVAAVRQGEVKRRARVGG